MKNDKLKQYVALRESLLKEKKILEERLSQINAALGEASAAQSPARPTQAARATNRVKNPMSLKAAVVKATSGKALSKPEILDAIQKLGYRFTAKDPVNSLNTVLYTKGQFKNVNGKFSPAK